MSKHLYRALSDAGLIRGGGVAERLGLEAVEFDWKGSPVTAYRSADVDAFLESVRELTAERDSWRSQVVPIREQQVKALREAEDARKALRDLMRLRCGAIHPTYADQLCEWPNGHVGAPEPTFHMSVSRSDDGTIEIPMYWRVDS